MQEYIENENARLEREHQFWAKEIVVKIEYKFCPNLTIIDTPGALPWTPAVASATRTWPFEAALTSTRLQAAVHLACSARTRDLEMYEKTVRKAAWQSPMPALHSNLNPRRATWIPSGQSSHC